MTRISTQDLSALPAIDDLKCLSQSLAMLDAILCPEWEYRFYSFNAQWSADECLASMRDGEGDHYFCLFNSAGVLLKGFAHEAPMSPYQLKPPKLWPGVLDQLPAQFSARLAEPALAIDETTFCIWRTHADIAWHCGNIYYPVGPITDGSAELLAILDGEPLTYQHWAQDYYQQPITLQAITAIYQHEPLTQTLITALNPTTSLQELSPDIVEIGYPRPSCS